MRSCFKIYDKYELLSIEKNTLNYLRIRNKQVVKNIKDHRKRILLISSSPEHGLLKVINRDRWMSVVCLHL